MSEALLPSMVFFTNNIVVLVSQEQPIKCPVSIEAQI